MTALCFIPQADQAIAEMACVLKPGGRLVIGELGRWSLWAAIRRVRGWRAGQTWTAARFRTADELQRLLEKHGLSVSEARGSFYYPPPFHATASLLRNIDTWLGRHTTLGTAFVVVLETKPAPAL